MSNGTHSANDLVLVVHVVVATIVAYFFLGSQRPGPGISQENIEDGHKSLGALLTVFTRGVYAESEGSCSRLAVL